jgi:serine/threonine protein kinase
VFGSFDPLAEARFLNLAKKGNATYVVKLVDAFLLVNTDVVILVTVTELGIPMDKILASYGLIGRQVATLQVGTVSNQVALALKSLHEHGIIHLDIKGANLIIVYDPALGWIVKVIDLGIAVEKKKGKILKDAFGCDMYMSPEAISGQEYDA